MTTTRPVPADHRTPALAEVARPVDQRETVEAPARAERAGVRGPAGEARPAEMRRAPVARVVLLEEELPGEPQARMTLVRAPGERDPMRAAVVRAARWATKPRRL